VIVQVEDDGPGIPAEHLTRVFDRFYRADAARDREDGGSGLGLAIARAIVEAHGGAISVANAPHGGAVFGVTLPSAVSAANPSGDAVAGPFGTPARGRASQPMRGDQRERV
jgi:signal transduction histidine kinase